ncbi:U5 small nuclear ribonucleoprotein TSSC4 [Cololabis saira]|uniref:U5 small nuclear ribonucleoprotein TSSC4 n=1 Tax=Cololabis saira TaxID=129043 RepID=UPI002AD54C49|nr:U5 small nuclear ribonucleoprotein TSSC4 [Cololabis saira]XP_061564618.1 U5 small nuclear ribonucleoprotein TSSC4 [Cololabis saira]
MSEKKRARTHGEALNTDVYELSASDESEPEDDPSRAPFDPEFDHSDEDDGEACAPAAAHTAQSSFVLTGGNSAFSYRSRNVFDCLESAETRAVSSLKQDGGGAAKRKTSQPLAASPAPAKKRGVPDYLVHPERWTSYSLEDVPESSDKDNRAAAQQFLSGLQKERTGHSPCDPQQRMIFSRPKRPQKEQDAEQPEQPEQPDQPDQQEREQGLHLSHLAEEEGRAGEVVKKNEEQGKDSEEVMSAPAEKKKQPQEETKMEESVPGFNSFKKTKGKKNYRRSSVHEDD